MSEDQEWDDQPKGGRGVSKWWLVLLPVIGATAGWFLMTFFVLMIPKEYESRAIVQIHGPEFELDRSNGDFQVVGAAESPSPETVTTEAAVMGTLQTLALVADDLDLIKRWGLDRETTMRALESSVETAPIPGTDLVEIQVRSNSPADARMIAENVVSSYKKRRNLLEMGRADRALKELQYQIRRQEDVVEGQRKILLVLLKTMGASPVERPDKKGGGLAATNLVGDAERALGELEVEKAQVEAEIEVLLRWSADKILQDAAGFGLVPHGLGELQREYLIEKRVMEGFEEAGMEDGDSAWIRQKAKVSVLDEELKGAVVAFRESGASRLKVLEKQLELTREVLSERRDQAVNDAAKLLQLEDGKQELENEQAILSSLKKQQTIGRVALAIPREILTVHEQPTAPLAAVSPDVEELLAKGKFWGASIGALVALLILAVRMAKSRRETIAAA